MSNSKITVSTKSKNYPIYFGSGILKKTGKLIQKNSTNIKKICLIVDKKIPPKKQKILLASLRKYQTKICKFSTNEKTKSLKVAEKIKNNLLENNFDRSDCIIAFGGGILSDLSAFIASIYKRGINFVNIPTTLLSQVDASIGGKTAVNSSYGKNLIGTFYQPNFVLADTSLLNSLPKREIVCGYAEILKHSLILDRKFFFWLNKNGKKIIENKDKKILQDAIIKSCKIKSKIVKKDEKEKNLRMILNFGHTFAHGFEGASNFSKKLNHGEAVLLGMITASKLAYDKKILSNKDFALIKKHYNKLNLPMKINKFFKLKDLNKIIYFMKKDKKNFNKKINLILIKKIGRFNKPDSFTIEDKKLKRFLSRVYF